MTDQDHAKAISQAQDALNEAMNRARKDGLRVSACIIPSGTIRTGPVEAVQTEVVRPVRAEWRG